MAKVVAATKTLSDKQKKLLDDLYYNVKNKSSLRGIEPLYKAAKAQDSKITLKLVKEWLKGQTAYTLWSPARKNYPHNKFRIEFCKQLMQFDLMDQKENPEKVPETGKLMKFALIAQDCYSRYTFCVPLSANKAKNIQEAIKTILDTGYKPLMALGDKAGEHISASTRQFFEQNDIHFYTTSSKTKAPQAERFIRTARTFIRRYQNSRNTDKWVEALKLCVEHYNHTKSRVTGEKPYDIMTKDEADWAAYEKMFGSKPYVEEKVVPRKNDPKPGDKVRLSRLKNPFEKESTKKGNWTREFFTVKDVSRNQKIPMYTLLDYKQKPLEGRAYAHEIQKVNINEDEDLFEVEKVLKRKKVNSKWQVFVKWLGYGSSFNCWIPQTQVKGLKQGTRNSNVH